MDVLARANNWHIVLLCLEGGATVAARGCTSRQPSPKCTRHVHLSANKPDKETFCSYWLNASQRGAKGGVLLVLPEKWRQHLIMPDTFFLHLLLPFSLVQYLISDQETCAYYHSVCTSTFKKCAMRLCQNTALFKSSGITVSVCLNSLFCLKTGKKLVIQHSLPLPCIMWNEGRDCSVRQVRAVSCFMQMWVGPSSPLWAGGCSQINAAPLRGRIQIKITVNVGWSICMKPHARRMRNANSRSLLGDILLWFFFPWNFFRYQYVLVCDGNYATVVSYKRIRTESTFMSVVCLTANISFTLNMNLCEFT